MKIVLKLCLFLVFFCPVSSFGQSPPITSNDDFSTSVDTALNIPSTNGLLQNDTDPDGDNLTVTIFRINGVDYSAGQTANIAEGNLTINADGSLTFNPTPGFQGSLPVIVYTITDGTSTSVGNLYITVLSPDLTLAQDDYDTAEINTTLSIPAPGVLVNDTYEDLNSISLVTFSINDVTYNAGDTVSLTSGNFTLLADGSYVFVPAPGFTGAVSPIFYTISDGIDTSTASLFLSVQEIDDLIEIQGLRSCNQGYSSDGNYRISYNFSIRNRSTALDYHPSNLINSIDFTMDLEAIFGTGCIVTVDELNVSTSMPEDFISNPYPQDFDINSVNQDFIDGISPTLFNTETINEGILYPRQSINISFCLIVNPFCDGRPNPTPSGSGIDFEAVLDVTSSKGDSEASLLLTDFHTTEAIVTGGLYIPEISPPENPDGTFDYSNFVTISNDSNVVANNVNFNMGLGSFFDNGLTFLTLTLSQVSGPTVTLNTNYDGDTNTTLLAPNTSLLPGEEIVIEIFHLLAPVGSSANNNFNQVEPSQTLGPLDGFDETLPENRRLYTFTSWEDNLGSHVDRYYSYDGTTDPISDQCDCVTSRMFFEFVSFVSCEKVITNEIDSPNGILEHQEYTFQITLSNTSPEVDLINLQLQEDLFAICGNEPVSFTLPEIISSNATADPALNTNFNGITETNIFDGNSGFLAQGETLIVEITVVFNEDCIGLNEVIFSGIDPAGGIATEISNVGVNAFTDTDNDGISNANDIDDDNDTILDVDESNGADPLDDEDGDFIPNYRDTDFGPDANNDGIVDSFDFDGDGVPNHFDLDSDNDGILDIYEVGNFDVDTDSDGRTNNSVGDNGLDNTVENEDTFTTSVLYTIINTDSDLNPDYLDIDADADGIVDNIEAQPTDNYIAPDNIINADGVNTAYLTGLEPVDTEEDLIPDYIDTNSDNDIRDDHVEGWDFDNDGTPEIIASGFDADNDGLDDAYDNDNTTINPTNGQVPTDFPNVDYDVTPERDWREIMAVVIVISNVSAVEGNDLEFTISLVTYNDNTIPVQSSTPIELTLFTTDGTDTSGEFNIAISPFDYSGVSDVDIVIPPFTETFNFTINSFDDNISELDELFSLNAEITSENTINITAVGIGTVLDNEMLPDITMNSDIVNEGEVLEYTITLSNPSSSPVDISIMTANNTAVAPFDFEALSTILSIDGTTDPSSPSLSVSYSIPTFLDNLNEPDSEILGVLGGVISSNVGVQDLTKTGTILDIDPNPFLVITDDIVVEGGTLVFTITLLNEENQPMRNYRPIELDLETVDITTTVNRDYNYFFINTSIPALETSLTQQIPTINDNLNEETEYMNLRADIFSEDISNSSSVLNGLGTIKDNDIPNLFSPNNDGQSDVFRIDGIEDFPNFKLVIFDRWGGEVYHYNNNGSLSPDWWDGTHNGSPVIEGVYFYSLDYNDGVTKPKTGFIQLVR